MRATIDFAAHTCVKSEEYISQLVSLLFFAISLPGPNPDCRDRFTFAVTVIFCSFNYHSYKGIPSAGMNWSVKMRKAITNLISLVIYFLMIAVGFNCNYSRDKINSNEPLDNEKNETAQKYLTLGLKKSDVTDYHGAIVEFDKAVLADPYFSEVYSCRADARYALNDFAGALKDCNKAVELSPNKARAFIARGNVRAMLKQFKTALEDYSKALELKPNNPEIYLGRAALELMLKQYPNSLNDFNIAIQLNPRYGEAFYLRGKLKIALGDKMNACLDISRAIKLGIQVTPGEIKYCK